MNRLYSSIIGGIVLGVFFQIIGSIFGGEHAAGVSKTAIPLIVIFGSIVIYTVSKQTEKKEVEE